MKELSPIQQLDFVLSSLDNYSKTINEIQKELNLEISTFKDVRMILEKLVKDKYAQEIKEEVRYEGPAFLKPPGGTWSYSYKLSFEGKVFIQQGGYREQFKVNVAENIRLDNLEKRQKHFEWNQTLLLTLVAVGTLIAAVYYLMEIGVHYHWWK